MFSAPEFRMIRRKCPDELKALLDNLSIPVPDFNADDERKIYDMLDIAIQKNLCFEMKSLTYITGYLKLLKMIGLNDTGTESDDDVIVRILDNEERIVQAAEKNVPKLPPSLEKSLITYETTVMIVPIVFGGIFLLMTLLYTALAEIYFPAVTVIGLLAGLGSIGFGLRGEQRIKRVKPPDYFVQLPPDVLTVDDVKAIISTLKILHNINQAMLRSDASSKVEVSV